MQNTIDNHIDQKSTLNNLNTSSDSSSNYVIGGMSERTFVIFMHLSQYLVLCALVGGFVPLIMWLIYKDKFKEVNIHGRLIVNWMISVLIYAVVFLALSIILIGIPFLLILGIFCLIFPAIGAYKASEGIRWKYPFSISIF